MKQINILIMALLILSSSLTHAVEDQRCIMGEYNNGQPQQLARNTGLAHRKQILAYIGVGIVGAAIITFAASVPLAGAIGASYLIGGTAFEYLPLEHSRVKSAKIFGHADLFQQDNNSEEKIPEKLTKEFNKFLVSVNQKRTENGYAELSRVDVINELNLMNKVGVACKAVGTAKLNTAGTERNKKVPAVIKLMRYGQLVKHMAEK